MTCAGADGGDAARQAVNLCGRQLRDVGVVTNRAIDVVAPAFHCTS